MRADLLQVERDLVRDERRRAAKAAPASDGETLPASGPVPRPRSPAPRSRLALAGVAIALGVGGLVLATTRASKPRPLPVAAANTGVAPTLAAPTPATTPPAAPAPPPSPTAAAAPPATPAPIAPSSPAPIAAAVARKAPGPKTRATAKPAPGPIRETGPTELLRHAEESLSAGRLEDARVLGIAAAERQPSHADTWEFLGRCYMRLGRPGEARTFYARYLALAPDGPKASFIRAIVKP